MRRLFSITLTAILIAMASTGFAQSDSIWTLQRCVQYALDHNISIQQNVLNERLSKLTLQQSQLAQLPSVNTSAALGRSYGRSIDPTSNQFINADYSFLSLSGNANVLLFGWFQQRNLITRNKYTLESAKADLEQLRDDVSLNVATGFLRVVLAREQIHINEKQVDLSVAQLNQTLAFVKSGRLPELNQAQLESQVGNDSANLITAIANYNAAVIDMKALLNLDFAAPFTAQVPDVELENQIAVSSMVPEQIYAEASKYFGSIHSAEYKLLAAQKNVSATRGALYPQLSLGGQIGTNWASSFKNISYQYGGYDSTGAAVLVNNVRYPVYQPLILPVTSDVSLGKQLNNNLRQTVSLNLNIPLFNGWQSQYNLRQAKINVANQELNLDQAKLNLKQNVYKAYNDAVNAIQKYYAALRANDAGQRAIGFAKKRYDLGLTSTVDYLVTQNTAYSAEYSLASAKYDLIFKLKVIDYYLGKVLKL